jgi:hypothetical protein
MNDTVESPKNVEDQIRNRTRKQSLLIFEWLSIYLRIIVQRIGGLITFFLIWRVTSWVLQEEIASSAFVSNVFHYFSLGLALFTLLMAVRDIIFDSLWPDEEAQPPLIKSLREYRWFRKK